MKSYRTWVLLLTLWFALLQTIAPLLHAHAAGDTAADDGPHMHMVDIPALHTEAAESQHPFHWHMHSDKSHGQIISLGQAITENNTLLTLIDSYADLGFVAILPVLLLLSACLLAPRRQLQQQQHDKARHSSPLNRHSPRGPPHA
ncbi:hypothetical protein [Methylophilus sp. 5]|uniref:hypothetical protein n=1 Tax=Methylophilus sp. 5 TaxID=1112274 RepID=UPI00048CBE4F|nr:hypothetical protein [Methylophilus sp. 5]